MSNVLKIYQTLEQRLNHDYVEDNGPFPCRQGSSWAYEGYYFWEHHIELGKFWGDMVYVDKLGKDYIICESEYELNDDLCYNYEGNPFLRDQFFESVNSLVDAGALRKNDTLHSILKYMKEKDMMLHDAFRFIGEPTMSRNSRHYESFIIKAQHTNVELRKIKEVQIVFFEKHGCNREGFEIVFESDLDVA